jgi:hypothetical protein
MASLRPTSAGGKSIGGKSIGEKSIHLVDLRLKYMDTESINLELEDLRSKFLPSYKEEDISSLVSSEAQGSHEKELGDGAHDAEGFGKEVVEARMEDIALKALHIDDDPSLNPWTLRMFVLGRPSTS